MPKNRLWFQRGLSLAEFVQRFDTEAQGFFVSQIAH